MSAVDAVHVKTAPGRGAGRVWKPALWVLALVVAALAPLVLSNPAYIEMGVFTLIYVTNASAWNLFAGYSGYISLGNGAFYGTGAYTFGILATHLAPKPGAGTFVLLLVAGLAAAVVAVPFGLVSLRTRRHTFVVISLAIFFLFQLLAYNVSFTGGSGGMQIPSPNWTGQAYYTPFFYVALILAVVTVLLSWKIRRSRLGLHLLAIRDDEGRARGLGVRTLRVKMVTLLISAALTGMAGGLYAYLLGQIFPQFAFYAAWGITVVLMCLVGGTGTVTGPILGALLLEPLGQWSTLEFSGGSQYLIVLGIVFLAVMYFLPRGLIPTIGGKVRRFRVRRRAEDRRPALPGEAVTGSNTMAAGGVSDG